MRDGTKSLLHTCGATQHLILGHRTILYTVWTPRYHKIATKYHLVALTRFKRTLSWARLSVRELTHTLHLPPAHAEIYGGPHSDWLRDILERLPRLQSLIVNGLPFFDHASLLTLRYSSGYASRPGGFPIYGLRLLDASNCSNATSTGLTETLIHFPTLLSLDLSRTIACRDIVVFSKLAFLSGLRVLKLRGLGLKDTDLEVIAQAIGTRVTSLDLRDNNLTDASARMLLEHCLKDDVPSHLSQVTDHRNDAFPDARTDSRIEDLDRYLRARLTQGFVARLAIEDTDNVGITHLHLSNNEMTVEGVSGLIRSKKLQFLDIGTLPKALRRSRSMSTGESNEGVPLPGPEKLSQVLAESAADNLTCLRINHAVVTTESATPWNAARRAELQGDLGTYSPSGAHELPTRDPIELDALEAAVHEMAGDSSQLPELGGTTLEEVKVTGHKEIPQGISRAPTIEFTIMDAPAPRRGSCFAPEVVQNDDTLSPISSSFPDATGGLSMSLSPVSPVFDGRPRSSSMNSDNDRPASVNSHRNSIYYIEDRRSRLQLRQSEEHHLHPGMLPKLHTLTLTDVPLKTTRAEIVHRLIQFIADCAEETTMAKLRAQHTYALPPGRSRAVAEREYARSLFALRRIVLEMAPPPAPPKKISTSWRQYPTKSSTEDQDSEKFWDAATHDFSFFGDEECGLPTQEPGRHLPLAAMSGLMLAPPQAARVAPILQEPPVEVVLDVVAEIAKFRKERKAAFQAAVARGDSDPMVEGCWAGDITVIRQPISPDAVDYYGNRFEEGWHYR